MKTTILAAKIAIILVLFPAFASSSYALSSFQRWACTLKICFGADDPPPMCKKIIDDYRDLDKATKKKLKKACPSESAASYGIELPTEEDSSANQLPEEYVFDDIYLDREDVEGSFHHWNPRAWHGKGSALVLCPGQTADTCELDGVPLTQHGAYDKGRQIFTDYTTPTLSGTIVCYRGEEKWSFEVGRMHMQYGQCN